MENQNNLSNENSGTETPQDVITHTFKDDANKYIRDKKISLTDIMLKEQNKITKKEKKKSGALKFILIIILLSLAVYGFIFAYNKFLNPPKTIIENSEIEKPFIYSDKIQPIYLENNENPKKSLRDTLKDKFNPNEFIYIPFIKDKIIITASEFLKILKIPAPQDFTNSLEDKFALILYSDNKKEISSILIFKTKNEPKTYASIIKWEESIAQDFSTIFPEKNPEEINEILNTATDTEKFLHKIASSSLKTNIISKTVLNATTSSSSVLNIENLQSFYDKTINNISVRIMDKNSKNTQSIIYGFFAEKYLIISTSEEVFKSAVNRLKISLE